MAAEFQDERPAPAGAPEPEDQKKSPPARKGRASRAVPSRRRAPRARKAPPRPAPQEPAGEAESLEELNEAEVERLADEGAPETAVLESPPPTRALARATALAPTDSLQRYMREVERHPLLTREEEHALAVRYRETGDLDAAYRLVTANLRLVVKIAHEYHRNTFSLLDLIQEGNVGLMHAVKKFDPYRGVKLSSYAAWWIRAYILRYIMDNWRIVKLGTTQAQRKLFFNLRKAQEKLAAQGFDPTPKLLAERLEVSEQDVTEMDQRLSQDELSLDVPVGEDGRSSRSERLAGGGEPVDERLASEELRAILREKLAEFGKGLKDKERYIFENRLVAEEPMTLQQIGDHYGLTRERARQLEAQLVRSFKAWIQKEVPDFKYLEIGARDD